MTAFGAAAPVRLDLAGGWTDVPPYSTREGGVVVAAALRLCAHAEVRPRERGYLLESKELEQALEYPDCPRSPETASFRCSARASGCSGRGRAR